MAPRKRKQKNQGLEPNLYCQDKGDKTYYFYIHPIEHYREPLGTDRDAANRTVRALNNAMVRAGLDPYNRAPAPKGQTVDQVIAVLLPKMLAKRKPASQKDARNYLARLSGMFGNQAISSITVRDLSRELEPLPDRSYSRLRWYMEQVFAQALALGYLPHNYGNPASVLEKRSEPKTKRKRLTLDQFKAIHAKAEPWLRTAMELMLATTLRPVDVINLQFDQVIDGAIYTEVRKTNKYIRIELSDSELAMIKRARDSVVSPYIVHRMPQRKGKTSYSKQKTHPTQLTVDYMSRAFSAIRNDLGFGGENPPTIYEIRSLSGWLYEQQGRDPDKIRALMAHTNQKMTDHYLYNNRHEFETVQAGLGIEL